MVLVVRRRRRRSRIDELDELDAANGKLGRRRGGTNDHPALTPINNSYAFHYCPHARFAIHRYVVRTAAV